MWAKVANPESASFEPLSIKMLYMNLIKINKKSPFVLEAL